MSTIRPSSNTSKNAAQSGASHQSAAMRAALLVRCQYSSESKAQFSRECLEHLKASLAHGQEATA
ncbi:hypothetical protein [Pseudomonas fragi]|uniref:Uncharacterized protein n=1 Tax=Pseudomonas fragi TaxID=296 RepID=A0A267AEL1_PSEFR|nr:hypothetical protein [Pseudomonas fragi]PAA10741.1 hypothetical protein CJU81_13370 [Pseudomonas fragi]